MSEANQWKSYTELAWVEPIIAPPQDYEKESSIYCRLINETAQVEVKNLLHLGCGAGINDYTFKKHFQVTGLDLSKQMLQVASGINPEVDYLQGDMRNFALDRYFEGAIVPDCVCYLKTEEELQKMLANTYRYLVPGGVLLITAHTAEQFQENNFVYTGSQGELEITIFENNYISKSKDSLYEATIIYLIRRNAQLEIHTDVHELGFFKLQTWLDILESFDFKVTQMPLESLYEPYLMGEGKYPLTVFVCLKK